MVLTTSCILGPRGDCDKIYPQPQQSTIQYFYCYIRKKLSQHQTPHYLKILIIIQ